MQQSEVISTLANTGFRPITLNSYREFISGIRYVAIETLGSEGLKVIQFLPTDHRSTWDIVRWDGAHSRSLYVCKSDRTKLDNQAYLRVGYDWFAKMAAKVNTTKDYFFGDSYTGYQNRGEFFQTLEMFLENTEGGAANPFDVAYSFERAHPANPTERQIADLDRQRAELAAREMAIRHRENFAQVDELRVAGSQFLAVGDQPTASEYFRQGEALQRRIQATLDRGEAVVREEINVTAPSYNLLNAGTLVASTLVARSYGSYGGAYDWQGISRAVNTPPQPKTPKLTTVETVDRKPRVIELEEEPENLAD